MIKYRLIKSFCTPFRSRHGDAGYDLKSSSDFKIEPGGRVVVPLGIAFDIPDGWYGLLTHRSSMAFSYNCICSLGVIDASFKGEVKAKFYNLGDRDVYIYFGDRIAQIVFHKYEVPDLHLVNGDFEEGKEGFGSSGRN